MITQAELDLYHKAGLRITPLHPFSKQTGGCGCGDPDCKMAGKHPYLMGWQKSPTSYALLSRYVEYNLPCDGFGWVLDDDHLVVDVDPRNGGDESFKKLCADVPELAEYAVGVKTGGGGLHVYLKKPAEMRLVTHHEAYPGIDFKSLGGFVVACGSLHASGEHYTHAGECPDPADMEACPPALLALLERPAHVMSDGRAFTGQLADVVMAIPNSDLHYEDWIKVGMGIHDTDPVDGYELWDQWSQRSSKYDPAQMPAKWASFGRNANTVTIGTLLMMAEAAGYRLGCTVELEVSSMPSPTADLTAPPGLVGEIASWINSTAFRDRPKLAVAAALVTVATAMGRMYVTPTGGKTCLYALGVAESGSGKDNPMQCAKTLLSCAGLGQVVTSEMASAQDMYNSLWRNYGVTYFMDEAHKILGHINDTRAPVYIQQIEGALLNLYTEKRLMVRDKDAPALTEAVHRQMMKLEKQQEDAPESQDGIFEAKQARLEKQLEALRDGLRDPFVSMLAVSTPGKIESMVNEDAVGSGLIGRFFVFREYESLPRPKAYGLGGAAPDKTPPAALVERVRSVVQRGMSNDKVLTWAPDMGPQYYGPPITVKALQEAVDISHDIHLWFETRAEEAKDHTQPILSRGWQQTLLIATLLACETVAISAEMLLWAFEFVKADTQQKISLVIASKAHEKTADNKERGAALLVRISELCDVAGGLRRTRLIDRLKRSHKAEDIEAAINHLADGGFIECVTGSRGAETIKTLKKVVDVS